MVKVKVGKLRKVRISQGYNQVDVCTAIGLNVSQYCALESGKTATRPKTAKKIYDFFGVNFDEIFEVFPKDKFGS